MRELLQGPVAAAPALGVGAGARLVGLRSISQPVVGLARPLALSRLLAGMLAWVWAASQLAPPAGAQTPTIEVVQTLIVEPATDAPLMLHLKTTGVLPPQSFLRIRGLPHTASLSEGHFVRPGVWAVPLSALANVRITVPAAQAGQSQLTISLVTRDNEVLAEARTTLVVGTASLFKVAPLAPKAPPAPAPKVQAVAEDPEVTLRMKGGAFELKGRLKSFEGGRYVIENKVFGTMTLDAANMECIGAGCPGQATSRGASLKLPTPTAPPDAKPGLSKVVGLHGSTAVGWELMPALIRAYAERIGGSISTTPGNNPLEELYRVKDAKARDIVLFDLKRYGTPSGFDALEDGSAQIGVASRPVNEQEAARLAKVGLAAIRTPQHEHVLGLDGLVIIVAQDSPAVSLSIDNIAKIFAGEITDWQDVGLPPGKINTYSTSKKSGTYATFDSLVLQPRTLTIAGSTKLLLSTAEVADAVAADSNGIGVTSFAFVREAKALNVESSCGLITRPSVFTVKTEEYPLTRRLYLYTALKPTNPHVKAFLDFSLSMDAQPVIGGAQFVDQTPDSLGFDDQGGRIAYALNASTEDFNITEMRQLIADMNGARRLSITFRFKTASSELDTKARADIDRLVALAATELKGKQILLLGFADSVGPYAGNAALSVGRATQVRETLLIASKGGIDPSLVVQKGYSELAPVACNDAQEGRHLNRRVEVWVRE